MENPFLNRLSSFLWGGIVVLVVLLAIYVSAGRMLTANVANYSTAILQELNARLPFTIAARQVRGEWKSFTPAIVLTDLRLSIPGSLDPPLQLSRGRIGVDVLNSLRTRSLQLTRLVLNDLSLRGELSRDGVLTLAGVTDSPGESVEQLREFLLNVESISLRNNRLILTMPSGEVRDLGVDLQLSREGSQRRVQATLSSSTGARLAILAQGMGDPFRPELFSGQVYVHALSTDMGAVQDLLGGQSLPVWADGGADLEFWLTWEKGRPSMAARLEGRDLRVRARDDSWQVPLQRVALDARLQQHGDRWTLFVSNLQVANGGVEFTLPRMQVDAGDNALQLRAVDVPLEPISALIADQAAVPDTLREVLRALHPQGSLPALRVSVNDIDRPSENWQIEANFEEISVESLHGAPGVTAASGYARLSPGAGIVILDSQATSLDFPAIYHQPLRFEDLAGTVHLDWDAGTVRLRSGLLTTRGEEGTARVLFGLDIPLQPSDYGIEMNLLVGLQDSRPTHRIKYIPYVLAPSLRGWLSDSIGEGRIEQGAFLWRGSLSHGAAPLRTIQLAFNVADTQLSYHPQWPPVLVNEGIVLIDDGNVSVWADRASLFDSTVQNLSVETRLNKAGNIMLGVRCSMRGPAADGFRVLNESPLAEIVGPTFADWKASGTLDTALQLQMNLSDKTDPPQVDVQTRWHDLDLLVLPGNLPLQAVNGEFNYSTTEGFRSSDLAGTLWGRPFSASLRQHHAAAGKHYDAASTVVDVDIAAQVDMADVRRWLQLESLAFATGQTAIDAVIRLSPGTSPVMTVDSALQGVRLDLPSPWQKDAEEQRQLHLAMPLAPGVMPLALDLGEQLRFRLNIADGAVRGGSLGVAQVPVAVRPGELRVTGHAPLLQGDQWLAFIAQYFGEGDRSATLTAEAATPSEVIADSGSATGSDPVSARESAPAQPLGIAIDELQADTLIVAGQTLENAVFSLALEPAQWHLSLTTDWLSGELAMDREGGPSRLVIERLDLDRLPELELSGDGDGDGDGHGGESSWDLPRVDVTLNNLFQSEQRLGELRFLLHGAGGVLTASDITGELAGLRLGTDQPGRLVWHRGEGEFTELQAKLEFADLGQTLEYFDYQRIVETRDGDIGLNLRWPGAPQDFSLSDGRGSMQVRIGPGNFLDATAGATGALRVVSILNLADIVRRLSLSNMFESGIPFDSVDGAVKVRDGLLKVDRMDVKGSSSFHFSGVSDVRTESLDGELVATLPVASNLPWIAALAASLPVAAGVYVVSQVFNKQMNRLSSAVYTIGGSWNEPEVNFDRIFDNTPKGTDAKVGTDVDAADDDSGATVQPATAAQDPPVTP